jgi:hypothetical protein
MELVASAARIASHAARHQSSGSCSAHAVRGEVNGACSAVAEPRTRPSLLTTTAREPLVPISMPMTEIRYSTPSVRFQVSARERRGRERMWRQGNGPWMNSTLEAPLPLWPCSACSSHSDGSPCSCSCFCSAAPRTFSRPLNTRPERRTSQGPCPCYPANSAALG